MSIPEPEFPLVQKKLSLITVRRGMEWLSFNRVPIAKVVNYLVTQGTLWTASSLGCIALSLFMDHVPHLLSSTLVPFFVLATFEIWKASKKISKGLDPRFPRPGQAFCHDCGQYVQCFLKHV